jgi:hypothetical protein
MGIRIVGIDPRGALVERDRPGRLPPCNGGITRSHEELGIVPISQLVAQTQPAAVDVPLGNREPGAAGQRYALGAGRAGDASTESLRGRRAPPRELLVRRRELSSVQMLQGPREGCNLGESGSSIVGQLANGELDLVENRDRGVTQQRAELRERPLSFCPRHDVTTALDERHTQPKLPKLEIRLGEQEVRGSRLLGNQLPGVTGVGSSVGNHRKRLRVPQSHSGNGELAVKPEADPRSQRCSGLRKAR